jgi:hypothetical protein
LRNFVALAVVAGLAACSGADAPSGGPGCLALFQRFDLIEATMSTAGSRADRPTIRPELQLTTTAIRQNRCISMSRELNFEAAPGAPVTDSGPRLVPPVRIHAGAVTSMADDAAARAFFAAHGVRATSIGSAALGRRIYIGPFASQGALNAALALARSAGFAYPYPARF